VPINASLAAFTRAASSDHILDSAARSAVDRDNPPQELCPRARPAGKSGKRQPRLVEKRRRPADRAPRTTVSDDALDVMSADSFPASDPPSFAAMRPGRRNT